MKRKMYIYYDAEGDFLELRFDKQKASYYTYLGDDIFERRNKKNGKIFGYAFYNIKKRQEHIPQHIEIELPLKS